MEDLTLIVTTSDNATFEDPIYFSSLQRGIIKALSNSDNPLSLNDLLHSLSKRPCARKLIPQVIQLKKSGVIVCEKVEPNCMDSRYELNEKWNEMFKE
jgi:hypothetical protein